MDIRTLAVLCAVSSLAACSPSESDNHAQEIAQTVEVGENAASQTPPYGIALYPDAKVLASLINGMGLQIESESSQDELGEFYRGEIVRLGYVNTAIESTDGKLLITGTGEDDADERLSVSISKPGDQEDRYTLVFLKTASE